MPESPKHRFCWIVPGDHPALAGHFPGDPLLPASALLDWIDQLAISTFGCGLTSGSTQAKFMRTARPGERLEALLMPRADGGFSFEVRSGDELAASGRCRPDDAARAERR